MNKLKSSVVIPYFNSGKYIDETLESLFAQTVLPDEIVLVDDGSTEKASIDKLEEVQDKYDIIVMYREHSGISGTLNFGAMRATGDIIFQLDSDDTLDKTYIRKFLEVFEKNKDVDGVTCGYKMFYDGVNVLDETDFHKKYMPEGLLKPKIFFENCAGGSNSAFRKSALEKINYWDESFVSFQDWGIWLKFAQHELKQLIIPEYLYFYRVRSDGDLQKENIMEQMREKLKKYKGLVEKNDEKFYTKEEYEKSKKEFYKNQKAEKHSNALLQNELSFKRLRQLAREFYLCTKREGIVKSAKRVKGFLKYGKGKIDN